MQPCRPPDPAPTSHDDNVILAKTKKAMLRHSEHRSKSLHHSRFVTVCPRGPFSFVPDDRKCGPIVQAFQPEDFHGGGVNLPALWKALPREGVS